MNEEYGGLDWEPVKIHRTPQEIAFMLNGPIKTIKYIEKNKMTNIFKVIPRQEKKDPVGINLVNMPRHKVIRIEDFN